MLKFDVVVLGATVAACHAALEAARAGQRTLLLPNTSQSRSVGSYLRTLQVRESVVHYRHSQRLLAGASYAPRAADFPLEGLRERLAQLEREQFRSLCDGLALRQIVTDARPARLIGSGKVQLGADEYCQAPVIVVATGSLPRRPARFPFDDRVVCDPDSILAITSIPRSLLVLGAQEQGCELACLFACMGTHVTMVDRRRYALRWVDRDVLEVLHERMQSLGIEVVLEESLEQLDVDGSAGSSHARVKLESGRIEVCDRMVVAGGKLPNSQGLGLEAAGVDVDDVGFIVTDEGCRTSAAGIYAAGEVIANIGHHADAYQARLAINSALGVSTELARTSPMMIHSVPEISMVGCTEEMCKRLDIPCSVGLARFSDLALGQVHADEGGFLKLAFDPTDLSLIGVQIIGTGAHELIHLGSNLIDRAGRIDELADGFYGEPSLTEAYALAARDGLENIGASPAANRAASRLIADWQPDQLG